MVLLAAENFTMCSSTKACASHSSSNEYADKQKKRVRGDLINNKNIPGLAKQD